MLLSQDYLLKKQELWKDAIVLTKTLGEIGRLKCVKNLKRSN